eukprot:s5238_g2.t2
MVSAALQELLQLFGIVGDVASLLSLLPLLAEAKFGSLLRQKRGSNEERYMPAFWVLLLLLVTEVASSAAFFDPSDKSARRAIGEVIRAQRGAGTGFQETVTGMIKLLEKRDVYELTRSVAMIGGLTGTVCIAAVETSGKAGNSMTAPLMAALRSIWAPRVWMLLVLAGLFTAGNWTELAKLARKPQVASALGNFAIMMRSMCFVAGVTGPADGPISSWALLNCIACVARICRLVMYEQLAPLTWLAGAKLPELPLLTGVGLEVWCVVVLTLCLVRRPGKLLSLASVSAPLIGLVLGGDYAAPFQPFVAPTLQRGPAVVAAVSAMLIFMGGFPTMISSLIMVQAAVHLTGGCAAFAGSLLLGRRIMCRELEPDDEGCNWMDAEAGKAEELGLDENWQRRFDDEARDKLEFQTCSYLQVMGMFTLWVGWYGFNAGSVLSADPSGRLAGLVSWNTTAAGSAAGLGACLYLYGFHLNLDVGFLCNGVLSGLVACTALCDVATPTSSIVIGLLSGLVVYPACSRLMQWARIDDPVDAVAVHAGSGFFGVVATAFCTPPCEKLRMAPGSRKREVKRRLWASEELETSALEFHCMHIQVLPEGVEVGGKVAHVDVLEKASVLESGLSSATQKTCLCCLEDFQPSSQVAVLPCGHIFDEDERAVTHFISMALPKSCNHAQSFAFPEAVGVPGILHMPLTLEIEAGTLRGAEAEFCSDEHTLLGQLEMQLWGALLIVCWAFLMSMFFFLFCAVCERVKSLELKHVREDILAQTDLNGSLSEAADSLLGIRLASVGERSSLVRQLLEQRAQGSLKDSSRALGCCGCYLELYSS